MGTAVRQELTPKETEKEWPERSRKVQEESESVARRQRDRGVSKDKQPTVKQRSVPREMRRNPALGGAVLGGGWFSEDAFHGHGFRGRLEGEDRGKEVKDSGRQKTERQPG